jgi:hypothetical protein
MNEIVQIVTVSDATTDFLQDQYLAIEGYHRILLIKNGMVF